MGAKFLFVEGVDLVQRESATVVCVRGAEEELEDGVDFGAS